MSIPSHGIWKHVGNAEVRLYDTKIETKNTKTCVELGLTEKLQEEKHQTRRDIFYHAYTIWLFTRSDLKTILAPSTLFAIISALSGPVMLSGSNTSTTDILKRAPITALWIWCNLLPFTVGNQRQEGSILEDSENKPWRPLPSKQINKDDASDLMLFSYFLAFALSTFVGGTPQCVILMGLGYWHNDLGGGDGHYAIRNLLNGLGYLCFTSGSQAVISNEATWCLKPAAYQWMLILAVLIFTTIQAQDMRDQEGDRLRGRRTLPLVIGDKAARYSIVVSIYFWSILCPMFWRLRAEGFALPCIFGAIVCGRFLYKRSAEEDRVSYRLYNIWIVCIYLLPLCRRLEEII